MGLTLDVIVYIGFGVRILILIVIAVGYSLISSELDSCD